MSYIDGKNVPGSRSPYTVWLRACGHVVGIDYQELNKYIREYNRRGYNRYFEFWSWFSNECDDIGDVDGFSVLWNEHNANMNKVLPIN